MDLSPSDVVCAQEQTQLAPGTPLETTLSVSPECW